MDDLIQLTAAGCTAIADGCVFRLRPLTLEDYGEIANCIRGQRPDASAELSPRLAEMSRAEQAAAWGRVFDRLAAGRRVTLDELDRWWRTPEGVMRRFWLMIRKDRPDVEWNEAADLFRSMSAEGRGELIRRMEDCDGLPADDPTARTLDPAEDGDGGEDAAAPPWWEWARRLSRRYGWTPAEIGRMTVAQIWIYLTDCLARGARRRHAACRRAGLLRRAAPPPRSVDSPKNGGRAMTILFKELAGSPTETYGPEGVQAERRLLCAYEDRLCRRGFAAGRRRGIRRTVPAQYPGWPWVFAARVRVEPFEKSPDDQGAFADLTADMNNYSNQFAQIIVNYELLDPGHRRNCRRPRRGRSSPTA